MSAQVQKRPGTVVRLFANLKGQRLRLGVVAVSIVIYVALSIWNPMYSAIVIDHLWATIQACWREGAAFTFAGGLGREMAQLTVQYLFTWLFYYLQSYLMASVAESLVLSLRSQVAQKLNRLPLRFFDQNKAGEILSRVTSDLDKISEVLQTGLLKLIVAVGTIIGSLIVMFCYSLTLTGIFLVFMVIGIGITNVVARRNLACAAQRQETIAVLTGVVEEYYHGRDVIKAYNHEADSIRKVSEAAEANRAANQKADFLTNCVNPLIRMLNRLGQVVIAVISGWAMLNGTMTVGVVQAFFPIYQPDRRAPHRGVLYDQLPPVRLCLRQAHLRAAGRGGGDPRPRLPRRGGERRGPGGLRARQLRLRARPPADAGHQLRGKARPEDRRGGGHRRG